MLKRLYTSLADRSLLAKGLCIVLIPLGLTSSLIYVVQSVQHDAAATVVGVDWKQTREQVQSRTLRNSLEHFVDDEAGVLAMIERRASRMAVKTRK